MAKLCERRRESEGKGREGRRELQCLISSHLVLSCLVLFCRVVRDDIIYIFIYSFASTPPGAKEIDSYGGEDLIVGGRRHAGKGEGKGVL